MSDIPSPPILSPGHTSPKDTLPRSLFPSILRVIEYHFGEGKCEWVEFDNVNSGGNVQAYHFSTMAPTFLDQFNHAFYRSLDWQLTGGSAPSPMMTYQTSNYSLARLLCTAFHI